MTANRPTTDPCCPDCYEGQPEWAFEMRMQSDDDRPATEPRTKAGKRIAHWLVFARERLGLAGVPEPSSVLAIEAEAYADGMQHLIEKRVAKREAEAAQGAAPSDDYTKGWNDALDGIVAAEGAAPRAEGPPDDRTCLTHPRQVAHDWHHQSYEGTWLCHCTVCGIVPNRAAPRAEGEEEWFGDAPLHGHQQNGDWYECTDTHAGAAPRAEGLDVDVETLRQAIRNVMDADPAVWLEQGDMADAAATEYARLSRPSDERVPESEEPDDR